MFIALSKCTVCTQIQLN